MFEIFIKRAAHLTVEENNQVDEVTRLAYAAPECGAGEQSDDIEWSNPEWMVLGQLEGQIVSLVCVLYREVQVNQQIIPVGGVGGVATHPNYQRRGLAGMLMEKTTLFLREEMKVPFGLLVCSDLRVLYYRKFGWQLLEDPMVFDWRGTKRVFHENTMVLPLGDQSWPRGTVDVCGNPW